MKGWLRIALGALQFSFPHSEGGETRWSCSLPDGLILEVEMESGRYNFPHAISADRAQLILSWTREDAVAGSISGDVFTLHRMNGGALERFKTRDDVRQYEYYRCLDEMGNQYQLRASYPLELSRDPGIRATVTTFWRSLSWTDYRRAKTL